MSRLEKQGEVVFAFAVGHLSEQAAAEFTELMQTGLDSGGWTQNWDDPQEPPQPDAR